MINNKFMNEAFKNLNDDWYHEVYPIHVKDNKPKQTFINWCQDKYYKRIPIIVAYNTYGIGKKVPGTTYCHVHSVLPEKRILGLYQAFFVRHGAPHNP